MALPETDPYADTAPNITTSTGWGHNWPNLEGTNFSAHVRAKHVAFGVDMPVIEAVEVRKIDGSAASFLHGHTELGLRFPYNDVEIAEGDEITVYNPMQFTRQNPAHIVQSTAFYGCGVEEAHIDTAAVDEVATELSTDYPRTVALFKSSCLEILTKMLEETGVMFMYIDGQARLSVGLTDLQPDGSDPAYWNGTSDPDFQLEDGEFTVLSYGRVVTGRKVPGLIRYGYEGYLKYFDIGEVADRAFPAYNEEWEEPSGGADWGIPDSMRLGNNYDALHVDDGRDDRGTYAVMSDFVMLKIRLGGQGVYMDIGNSIRPLSPGLNLTGLDGQDIFIIHEHAFDPMTFVTTMTLLKKATWTTWPI